MSEKWEFDGSKIWCGDEMVADLAPETFGVAYGSRDTDADGKLIVRAVNSHTSLVEACETVLSFSEGLFSDERAIIECALKEAKGEV